MTPMDDQGDALKLENARLRAENERLREQLRETRELVRRYAQQALDSLGAATGDDDGE